MKIAYFDCQFGAAGDMLNAALLAAGVDEQAWLGELRKLKLPDTSFQLRIADVMRCNIACKKLDVFDAEGEKLDAVYARQVNDERLPEFQQTDEPRHGAHMHQHSPAHAH